MVKCWYSVYYNQNNRQTNPESDGGMNLLKAFCYGTFFFILTATSTFLDSSNLLD